MNLPFRKSLNNKCFVLEAQEECCFRYGFGARMIPCCLSVITCEEHDLLAQGPPLMGGAFGKHHTCPATAEEAHEILSGGKYSKFSRK